MKEEWIAYVHGNIIPMHGPKTAATAFITSGGRFIRVGSDEEIIALLAAYDTKLPLDVYPDESGGHSRSNDTSSKIIDLEGKTVVPGFIESHNHFSVYAMNRMRVDCSPAANPTINDLKARLKDAVASAQPGEWIQGYGYDDSLITDNRHLTRQDLDEVAPHHPVHILHISVHFSYVNSRALEIAGVGPAHPQPDDGEIHQDPSGQPTGLLKEPGAMNLVMQHIPLYTTDQIKAGMLQAGRHFQQVGITSIHDGGIGYFKHGQQVVQAYGELEREGRLPFRVYMTLIETLFRAVFAKGLRSGFGSTMLRLGSVKSWQDGSIQGYTGALQHAYHSMPDYCGELLIDQEVLNKMVATYHEAGCQVALHANGDKAIDSVLCAFEYAYEQCPDADRRHMIIHCQTVTDEQIQRIKALGIIPNYFVNHVFYWGDRHKAIFLGPERAARIDPLNSSLQEGVTFALHSDMPVTPPDPMFSIHTAVNRMTQGEILGAEERIPVYEALKAYTINAARCSFEEGLKGSIEVGKLADFLVLSENPLTVAPERLKEITVLETVLAGQSVYRCKA